MFETKTHHRPQIRTEETAEDRTRTLLRQRRRDSSSSSHQIPTVVVAAEEEVKIPMEVTEGTTTDRHSSSSLRTRMEA